MKIRPTIPKTVFLSIMCGHISVAASQMALGQTIFQHSGSNNPAIAEGWERNISGADVQEGPIDDGGTPAWFIDDNSLSALWYARALSAEQSAAASRGWTLSLNLRIVDIPDSSVDGSPFGGYINGIRYFVMNFGTQPDGDPIVHLPTELNVPSLGPTFALEGGGSGYHLYQLRYDPSSATADLFIDGVERISDYLGIPLPAAPRVLWGAGTGDDTGQGNFNLVQFEVVPEATTLVLVTIGSIVALAKLRLRTLSS